MIMSAPPLDAAAVRYARFVRSGFQREGAVCDVVRGLLAVQAQDPEAALLSIYGRSNVRRDAIVNTVLLGEGDVARVWGMRCTLQLVHRQDWGVICAAVRESTTKTRMSALRRFDCAEENFDHVMQEAVKVLEGGGIVKSKDVERWTDHFISEKVSDRLAEKDLIGARACVKHSVHMLLTIDGHGERVHQRARPVIGGPTNVVIAPRKEGTPWETAQVQEAVKSCAVRFFAAYAPASETDFRYWMGINAGPSKRAVKELEEQRELVAVPCTDAAVALLAHESVAAEVLATVVPSAANWSVRLLGRFDPMLLAHKNKGWLVGDAHRRRIWSKNADIAPTVLVRGRIRGTWRRKGAEITVRLFPPCKDDDWIVSEREIASIGERSRQLLTEFWQFGEEASVVVVRELSPGREETVRLPAANGGTPSEQGPGAIRRSKRKRKS